MAEGDDKGNPVPIILGVVIGFVLVFVAANVGAWWWAQKHAPPKMKKKDKGAKFQKRERLRQGLAPAGEN